MYMKHTIPTFRFNYETGHMKTVNSGYVGGTVSMVIGYLAQQLSLLSFEKGDDQGSINILYVTGEFEKRGIPIAGEDIYGKVRHVYFNVPKEPFPHVVGYLNKNITAALIHLYYRGDHKFILSVLRVCPRITPNMANYLTKKTENITVYERELENETLYYKEVF